MPSILGQITARLLGQYGADSPGWNPPRTSSSASKSASKSAEGHALGRGPGRTKQ